MNRPDAAPTNAARHARGHRIAVRLVRGDALLGEVDDEDRTLPTLLSTGLLDEYGRGLRVLSTLAREWGADRNGTGKTVWCELALPGRTGRQGSSGPVT